MPRENVFSFSLNTGYCNHIPEYQVNLNFKWRFLKSENGVLIFINNETNQTSLNDFPKDQIWLKFVNNTNESRRINLDIHNLYTVNNSKTEEVGFLEIIIPKPTEISSQNAIVRLMRNVRNNLGKIYQSSTVRGIKVLTM
jgi:hypothetical protein